MFVEFAAMVAQDEGGSAVKPSSIVRSSSAAQDQGGVEKQCYTTENWVTGEWISFSNWLAL